MITTNGVTGSQNYYNSLVQKQNRKEEKVKSTESGNGKLAKTSESKLSDKAKEYLDKLRKDYGDYDFIVADDGDDKIAVAFNDDGSMTIFAELEKSSAKQKELAEKAKEKRAEEKKAQEEKSAEKADKKNPYDKKDDSVKRVTIEADSEEELMEKIGRIDWDKVKSEQVYPGERFSAAI